MYTREVRGSPGQLTLSELLSLLGFQQPFRCEIEHKLGVSCMGSGPVLCRVALDRGGYVPGETIAISATIRNHSRVTIKNTKAALTEVRADFIKRMYKDDKTTS